MKMGINVMARLISLDKILAHLAWAGLELRQPIQIGEGEVDETILDYYVQIEDLAGRALDREIERLVFIGLMSETVGRYLRRLFLIGTDTGDIPDTVAQADFDAILTLHRDSIPGLADDIYDGRYDANEETGQTAEVGRALLLARLVLWSNKGGECYPAGQLHNPAVEKYGWRLGSTVEHCDDCLRLNGQVHTKEDWRASGYRPQGGNLECGGWNCDCKYVPSAAADEGGF